MLSKSLAQHRRSLLNTGPWRSPATKEKVQNLICNKRNTCMTFSLHSNSPGLLETMWFVYETDYLHWIELDSFIFGQLLQKITTVCFVCKATSGRLLPSVEFLTSQKLVRGILAHITLSKTNNLIPSDFPLSHLAGVTAEAFINEKKKTRRKKEII